VVGRSSRDKFRDVREYVLRASARKHTTVGMLSDSMALNLDETKPPPYERAIPIGAHRREEEKKKKKKEKTPLEILCSRNGGHDPQDIVPVPYLHN
jgi:hypothetical protein